MQFEQFLIESKFSIKQGYAYAHKSNPKDIIVQDNWKEFEGRFKTPTVIKYEHHRKILGIPCFGQKTK